MFEPITFISNGCSANESFFYSYSRQFCYGQKTKYIEVTVHQKMISLFSFICHVVLLVQVPLRLHGFRENKTLVLQSLIPKGKWHHLALLRMLMWQISII